MKAWLILGFVALLGIYHLIGYYFGLAGKTWVLSFIVLVSIALIAAIWFLRRRLKRDFAEMSVEQQSQIMEADPECNDPYRFEHRWQFKMIDVGMGILFAFLPPFLISVFRGDTLSSNTAFTGFHLLAMMAGVGVYIAARHFVIVRLRKHESELFDTSNEQK